MRVLGFTSASTAGLLLLLLGTAPTTTRTTSSAAPCGDQVNDTSERKELTTFADAGAIAKIGNMPGGTAATPHPPLVSEYASFAALAGVNGDIDKTQKDTPGHFGWLPHLAMTMDEATAWSGSSGVDTPNDFVTSSANALQEVPAGLRVDFPEEPRDEAGEGFRWTRFEQDSSPPRPPDQAFDRAFNALLYVCHNTNADHIIRVLLYGSKCHRRRRRNRNGNRNRNRRRRRNRRANPNSNSNSTRNRRLRRILRLAADIDRALWSVLSQVVICLLAVSPFLVGDGPEEANDGAEMQMDTPRESSSSPLGSSSAAAASAVFSPAPSAVPVALWPQMADRSAVLTPVPSLALLTLLETPAEAAAAAAPWPPLSPFPPTAALGVDIAIPLHPVAATTDDYVPLGASVKPLDAAVGSLDAAKWSSVAKTLTVKDLHKSDRMVAPERGWGVAIEADLERLWLEPVAARPSELVAVRWILMEAVRLYPFTGYTQGSQHAALAIYREMGEDKSAALEAFVRWASAAAWLQRSTIDGEPVQLQKGMRHSWKVLRMQSPTAHTWLEDETMDALYSDIFLSAVGSLCTCQGLPRDVVRWLIEKTLQAGKNGPAVSLWVMHCLLTIAESECKRKMDATPDLCVRTRLVSAGKTVTSFEDLSRHAPMPLGAFLQGYEAAVFTAQTWCFWRFVVSLVSRLLFSWFS